MAKKKTNIDTENSEVMEPKTKKKAAKKKVEKQQNLEDILFECRNKLRGNANMTTKRDMLLTLVFLRFICSRFNEQKEKIKADVLSQLGKTAENLTAEEEDFIGIMQQNKSSYEQDGVFYLQDAYNWEVLISLPASERAISLDNGITKLMDAEKNLKNALPANLFVNARLEPAVLKGVMDDINKIDPRNFKDIDLIGRVYEYFLQQFAVNATKEDGEFYTPQSIVELIANLIEPYDGTIYDPCCGSGGMFVQSVRLIEAHGGNKRNVSVYGQESDPDTYRLAKMNLAARGISYHLGDSNASSFTNDKHPTLRASYIMANPPFNLKDWRTEETLTKDARWKGYGLPPVGNANYAWILHMLYHLDQVNGIAGFLMGNGALDDEDTVAIREQLIRNDKVEAIIILPREMFYSTDLSCTLWILNQNKRGGIRNGRPLRNRENEVFFLDLRLWNQNTNTLKTDQSKKTFVVFNDEQLTNIAEIFHRWQGNNDYESRYCDELYYTATKDEIESKNWSLIPSRYIKFVEGTPDVSKSETLKALSTSVESIMSEEEESLKTLASLPNIDKILEQNSQFPIVELRKYIKRIDKRNTDNSIKIVKSVSVKKILNDTNAKVDKTKLHSYKILEPDQLSFVQTTGNEKCLCVAINKYDYPVVVTSVNEVFETDKEYLLPDYLHLFFLRKEMDRYARFHSWGSIRETFKWEDMCRVKIPLPDIETQRAIVNIYRCAEEAKRIAEEADRLSREICPALMQHIIHESETTE